MQGNRPLLGGSILRSFLLFKAHPSQDRSSNISLHDYNSGVPYTCVILLVEVTSLFLLPYCPVLPCFLGEACGEDGWVTKTTHALGVLRKNLLPLSQKLKALWCWHLLSFFTYFNTAHSRVKMENKNENKAKLRTTACTTKHRAREKAELLCLRQGWTLNVLLEAANDNTTGKVNLSSPCSHNILKTQQKTKEVLNSKCRIFQHDSIISHFRSAITVLWSAFGPSSLIAWVGGEQAMTDVTQQPATVPSLLQREQ